MRSTGSNLPDSSVQVPPKPEIGLPLWLLAELTYRCPLQCPYCSNPLDFAEQGKELSTEQWIKVFREAREMGAAQLGFSGGEPLVRQDLAELIGEARKLGFHTNLITSGIGLTEQKISDFKKAGLDHIQISFQASDEQVNNLLAGSEKAFAQKLEMARAVKAHGYPMALELRYPSAQHRQDRRSIIELCMALEADFVELGHLPVLRLGAAQPRWAVTDQRTTGARRTHHQMNIGPNSKPRASVQADFRHAGLLRRTSESLYERLGQHFLTVTPDGTALPCHGARDMPGSFPTCADHSMQHISVDSFGFNRFRGYDWIPEPCRSGHEKEKDFGGLCRCQAFMLHR